MRLAIVTVLGFICEITHSMYISSSDKDYVAYLVDYGYLSDSSISCGRGQCNVDDNDFANALRNFQNYGRIGATGSLDSATKNLMSLSRCEAKDVSRYRRKRYTTIGHWPKKHVTYKIVEYSTRVDRKEVDSLIFLGFSVWSQASGITFTRKQGGKSDIIIRFAPLSGKHNNRVVYGNTKNKRGASVITLNDDIPWSQDFTTGVPNLFQTVSHEVGHVIGMGHTDVTGAMMYPIYDLGIKIFGLHDDDIRGIQENYKDVHVISYPGRPDYRKFASGFNNKFKDFKSHIENSFGNFGNVNIGDIQLPKDFFPNGF